MLKSVVQQKLRQRGFEPKLSDSEVITMEIVAEFLGIDTDKGTWEYFSNHWLSWFPNVGPRANFPKHATYLWALKQEIQKTLANAGINFGKNMLNTVTKKLHKYTLN